MMRALAAATAIGLALVGTQIARAGLHFSGHQGQRPGESQPYWGEMLGGSYPTIRIDSGARTHEPNAAYVAGSAIPVSVYISNYFGVGQETPSYDYRSARIGYKIDGKDFLTPLSKFTRTGPTAYNGDGELRLPADTRGPVQVWLELKAADGSTRYLSNQGANYTIYALSNQIKEAYFGKPENNQFPGLQESGASNPGTLRVKYEKDRLTVLGVPRSVWYRMGNIPRTDTATISFKSGDGREIQRVSASLTEEKPEATLEIPTDATSADIWFFGRSYDGREAWDSNFGKNFTVRFR